MSPSEQTEIKREYYSEAIRYMENDKDCLKKAKKENDYYNDAKYVRMACGTAYNGVLIALDGFLVLRGVHTPDGKKLRKSIEHYQSSITKIDKAMLKTLNSAYKILHLYGYYDGIEDARVVSAGFDNAYKIIDKIKPEISEIK
jgi:uncharacterized protein (UPF0332 family)